MTARIPDGTPLISAEMLQVAADPSLPPGVIGMVDDDGNTWRYPLAEYLTSEVEADD